MNVANIPKEDKASSHVEHIRSLLPMFDKYVSIVSEDKTNVATLKGAIRTAVSPVEGLDDAELKLASDTMEEEIDWCEYNTNDANGSFEVLGSVVELGKHVLIAANAITHPGFLAVVYKHNLEASKMIALFTVAAIEAQQDLLGRITDQSNMQDVDAYRMEKEQEIKASINELGRIDNDRVPLYLDRNELTRRK